MAPSPPFLRYMISKNTATFKSRSEVTQGHRNWYIRQPVYGFLLSSCSNL